jgi:hypothetical protein
VSRPLPEQVRRWMTVALVGMVILAIIVAIIR